MADRWAETRRLENEVAIRIAQQYRQPWRILRNRRLVRETDVLLRELDAEITRVTIRKRTPKGA